MTMYECIRTTWAEAGGRVASCEVVIEDSDFNNEDSIVKVTLKHRRTGEDFAVLEMNSVQMADVVRILQEKKGTRLNDFNH